MTDQSNARADSTADTLRHMQAVQTNMARIIADLTLRAGTHDMSKLLPPEKALFDQYSSQLRTLAYGSPDYRNTLNHMRPAIDHHYEVNDHHPEHYKHVTYEACPDVRQLDQVIAWVQTSGLRSMLPSTEDQAMIEQVLALLGQMRAWATSPINGMTLPALVEMLCDWQAATQRHATGSLGQSLPQNQQRWAIADQIISILRNTAAEYSWE